MNDELGVVVWLRVRDRPVLVVGGGPIALAKCAKLRAAGARVTIVALQAVPDLAQWAARGEVIWMQRAFVPSDVAGQFLVLAATGADGIDRAVFAACEARQVWCNSADVPDACSTFLMAERQVGPVTLAVGTAGEAPGLAGRIADIAVRAMPAAVIDAVSNYSELRRFVLKSWPASPDRMALLRWLAQRPWRLLGAGEILPTTIVAKMQRVASASRRAASAPVANRAKPR